MSVRSYIMYATIGHWRLREMFCFVHDPQKRLCAVTIAIHITLHALDMNVPTKLLLNFADVSHFADV